MSVSSHYATVWKLHSLGYSVIPSGGGDSGKAPLVPWTEYQSRQPTDVELDAWERELQPHLWGVVTGAVVVFDADTPEANGIFEAVNVRPHVKTPRGGGHYYFRAPGHPVKTVAGLLPGLDVRGAGGFVNVAGHNHKGAYTILLMPSEADCYRWEQLPPEVAKALSAPPKPVARGEAPGVIVQGGRNHTLASLGGTMRRRGMGEDAIAAALLETNRSQCHPPLPESEVLAIAASVARYEPTNGYVYVCNDRTLQPSPTNERFKNVSENVTTTREGDSKTLQPLQALAKRIIEWVTDTTGWWATEELDKDLGISGTQAKNNRRLILHRLKEQGRIEAHPRINKQWRFVNQRVTALDFKTAPTAGVLPVKWPMGVEKYVNLFPGNIVVVAGAPNSGKTALLLNLIRLNMAQFPTYYFCSEMGPVELRNRLEEFPGMSIEDWQFKALERSSDFEDVIVPDALNVVDYLEMTDELYRVNSHLTAISHKIGSGLAVVALQKKTGATYGRGQEFGLEKPKLYLSVDAGKLTIVKGKSWSQRNVNPNGMTVGFKIVGGCQFEITKTWDWPPQGV